MTQMNKFEDLNDRFASLGTGMTQRYKFRDRWCTLLYKELARKFDSLADYNVELANKAEKLGASANTPKKVSFYDIIKKDASTSYIDLIDLDSPPFNKLC